MLHSINHVPVTLCLPTLSLCLVATNHVPGQHAMPSEMVCLEVSLHGKREAEEDPGEAGWWLMHLSDHAFIYLSPDNCSEVPPALFPMAHELRAVR